MAWRATFIDRLDDEINFTGRHQKLSKSKVQSEVELAVDERAVIKFWFDFLYPKDTIFKKITWYHFIIPTLQVYVPQNPH